MSSAPAKAPNPGGQENNRISAYLQKAADRLEAALPSHLTADRMVQVVSTMVYRTPKLRECDPASILSATLQAASLGLDLTPGMNEAFLIPRWNKNTGSVECQFQPGYQGLVKLARQSGEVRLIQARVVRERDRFHYAYTPDLVFEHVPTVGPEAGPTVAVYAFAKLANGETMIEVMTADEVEAIHRRSEGYQTAQKKGWTESGPWVTDWDQMACKTVLKRLCKSLPRSLELAHAIELDNVAYEPGSTVVSAAPRGRGVSGLKARFQALEAPSDDEGPSYGVEEGVPRPLRTEPDDEPEPDHDALHREAFDEANPMPPVDPEDAEIDRMAARETGLFPAGGGESVDPEEGGKGARRGGRR